MAVVTICDQGFVADTCSCITQSHPAREVPCVHDDHDGDAYVDDRFTTKETPDA